MKITVEMLKNIINLNDIEKYLPKGLTKKDITEVEIPNSVKKIGNNAFFNCRKLKIITLPKSIKELGDGAFYNCISLKSVNIPKSITKLNNNVFWNCKNLKTFIVPRGFSRTNRKVYRKLKRDYPTIKIVFNNTVKPQKCLLFLKTLMSNILRLFIFNLF